MDLSAQTEYLAVGAQPTTIAITPTTGADHGKKCSEIGEELLKCVALTDSRICRVRIRRVSVDLEIEDEDRECSD